MFFDLGKICATQAVAECFNQCTLMALLDRYSCGDWGNLCDEDKEANMEALKYGGRIFACYNVENERIYIITEADRSYTTLLFSYEY